MKIYLGLCHGQISYKSKRVLDCTEVTKHLVLALGCEVNATRLELLFGESDSAKAKSQYFCKILENRLCNT